LALMSAIARRLAKQQVMLRIPVEDLNASNDE
jgi:hypothetical protein